MADPLVRLRRFLRELKRRNVYRVAVTYLVSAFVAIQAADLLVPETTLPAGAETFVIYVAVVGFPIALVLAWAFEMTPEGVRRTPGAEPSGEGPEPAGTGESRRSRSRLAVRALVGLGMLAAAGAGIWYLTGSGGAGPEIEERTVAVLPFQVSGSGAETWRDGMVTYLTPGLDGAAGLRAIPDRTVFAAWEDRAGGTVGASAEEALSIAREVGARYAVIGSAGGLGSEVRFAVEIYTTGSGERLGQVEVRGSPENVPSLADSLTRRVLSVILAREGQALSSVDLGSITTRSLPALKAYLRGERHFRSGEYEAAVHDLRAAIEEDSAFALAYARLARSHGWLSEHSRARRTRRRAFELADRLPERERRLVRAQFNWLNQGLAVTVADTLRQLTEAYPDDPSVWYEFGEVLFHGWVPARWQEVEEAFERAVELDPDVAPYHHHLVEMAFFYHHDSTLAARRIADHPPGLRRDQQYRLALDLVFGTPAYRKDALARLDTVRVPPGNWPLWPIRVCLLHPTDAGLRATVADRIRKREDVRAEGYPPFLTPPALQRGQVRHAVQEMEALGLEGTDRLCPLSLSATLGLPVPDSVLEPLVEPSAIERGASSRRLLCAGYYLVERERSEDVARLTDRLRKRASAAADSPSFVQSRARRVLDALEGYRAWKADDPTQAMERWSGHNMSQWAGAIWRGDIHRSLGEREKAEAWYLAAWGQPVAHERLGQLYEEMDRPDEAAAAYRRFVAAWEDADEALQPRVEAARERVRRLTGSVGEAGT